MGKLELSPLIRKRREGRHFLSKQKQRVQKPAPASRGFQPMKSMCHLRHHQSLILTLVWSQLRGTSAWPTFIPEHLPDKHLTLSVFKTERNQRWGGSVYMQTTSSCLFARPERAQYRRNFKLRGWSCSSNKHTDFSLHDGSNQLLGSLVWSQTVLVNLSSSFRTL